MAARPNPLSALKLCARLARNSRRRLEAAIECANNALDTNIRLTDAERKHYTAAIRSAVVMLPHFDGIAGAELPKPPPKGKRKIGRPSQREVEKAKARRKR